MPVTKCTKCGKDYDSMYSFHDCGKKGWKNTNWHFIFWRSFWLILTTAIFSYFLFWVERDIKQNHLFLYFIHLHWVLFLFFLFLILGLLIFLFKPKYQLQKQKINSQPSWVYYCYFGLITSPVAYFFIKWLLYGKAENPYLLIGIWVLISGILLYNKALPKLASIYKRFAAGSVNSENDQLGFSLSAKNACEGFLKLDDYVNVVGLYGGLGCGKSSYARMIIENFDDKKILYTYISLTETNAARDFSILFAERWFETLSSKYPKIDVSNSVALMRPILRESGNGLVSDIIYFISKFSPGLIKTKAKIWDRHLGHKPNFVSTNTAKLFGNVTEFNEDLWIIVIDEIERARLGEIYRVIEVIERFKAEGRDGLPLKIIFLLCIAREELEVFLNGFDNNNDTAMQIKKFFFEDPKSVTQPLFLPPIQYNTKEKFVVDQIKDIRREVGISKDGLDKFEIEFPLRLIDPIRQFLDGQKKGYDFIVNLLITESPRIIQRTISSLRFFYQSFFTIDARPREKQIRFSDLLTLSYIKVKYPFLIDFFTNTIHELLPQSEAQKIARWTDRSTKKDQPTEKKKRISDQIMQVANHRIPDQDREIIEKLVAIVAYPYIEQLNERYEDKNKIYYAGTSSYAENLNDFLLLIADYTKTPYTTYHKIYSEHLKNIDYPMTLKVDDLLGYSRFIRDYITEAQPKIYFSVVTAIFQAITQGKIEIQPRNVKDTLYDTAIYEFIFQLLEIVLHHNTDENLLQSAVDKLVKILLDKKLNTGLKYIILNSFANNTRGRGSLIHQRLEEAFQKMLEKDEKRIRDVIKYVFDEANERYLNGKDIIYKNEENFFYVMYQGWSGKKDRNEEIDKIQKLAKRDLEKYHDAISLYWNHYPLKEGWRNFEDVLRNNVFFADEKNRDLYMPLRDLIAISKKANIKDPEIKKKIAFWEGMVNDPRYQEVTKLKDDLSTLKAVLISRGF